MLTRRALFSVAAATGLGAVLAACTRSPGDPGPPTGPSLALTGDREQVLDVGDFGMLNFPDGHMTFLDVAGARRMWVATGLEAGGGRTVALDVGDDGRLTPADLDGEGDAVPGLVPVGGTTAIDADYCGPGSVFPSADGTTLWLVYHAENHTFAGVTSSGRPFYATVGLASSTDGGRTWERRGPVITGQVPRDDAPAPREVVGAGSPCAVVDGDVVHVFYVDWNLDTPDQIHLARVPLAQVDDPAAWQKWHDGSFSTPGTGGASTAVVTRPGDGDTTVFAGNPSVSWNTYLQRYVLVHDTADGYWWTHSADLTTWEDPQQFLARDADQLRGTTFVTYPSLLTVDAPTDRETGQDVHLYIALGFDEGSHSMWRIPARFSR